MKHNLISLSVLMLAGSLAYVACTPQERNFGPTIGTDGGAASEEGGGAGGGGIQMTGDSASCGNAKMEDGEGCDDGNLMDDDGCSESCQQETGWACSGSEGSVCQVVCGDGLVTGEEASAGSCDDGDTDDLDGCDSQCNVETSWFCGGEPSVCAQTCGNGTLEGLEACDDGNTNESDGCNACAVSSGFLCDGGEPTTCEDVDECASDNGGCHERASCSNTPGSFACTCDDAYFGDGFDCWLGTTGVSAAKDHTCVVTALGGVRCWGDDLKLGYGLAAPGVGDVNVGANALQVSAGDNHTCVLLDGDNVRCWGTGNSGRLGYGNTTTVGLTESPAAIEIVPIGETVKQLSTRYNHSCALLSTDQVRCWGWGEDGRLGYGDTQSIGDNETPADKGDVPVGRSAKQISVGFNHTCAVTTDGEVRCWGDGSAGQLGYGNTDSVGGTSTAKSAVRADERALQVGTGIFLTCALFESGAVSCWGDGGSGLGYGDTDDIGDTETPRDKGTIDVGGVVTQIAVGGHHVCALLDSGAVRCWGSGASGQLGYGNTEDIGDDETPASVGDVDVGGEVELLTAGNNHTCAVLTSGALRCWGAGSSGQLGYAHTENVGDDETPASAGDVVLP